MAERVEHMLLSEIRRRVEAGQQTRSAIMAVFRALDKNNSGMISRSEFRSAVRQLGYELLQSEANELVSHFDRNGDGMISYSEFVDTLLDISNKENRRSGRWSAEDIPSEERSARAILQEVERRINAGQRSRTALLSVFRTMDRNKSGMISAGELRRALLDLGYPLSDSDLDTLVRFFDQNGDKLISYGEFIDTLVKLSERGAGGHDGYATGMESTRVTVDEQAVRSLLQEIKQRIQRGYSSRDAVMDVFRSVDTNNSGKLSKQELHSAVYQLGYDLSSSQLGMIMSFFDRNGDGMVSYREFIDGMGLINRKVEEEKQSYGATRVTVDEQAVRSLLQEIKQRIQRGYSSRDAVMDVFRSVDTNNSGKLSRQELHRAVYQLGYDLSSSQLGMIMSFFDRNGDGMVSYREFIDGMGLINRKVEEEKQSYGATRVTVDEQAVRSLLQEIKQRIQRGYSSRDAVMDVFRSVDTNNSGKLSRQELHRAVYQLGYDLSSSQLGMIMSFFDRNGDGMVSYREFIDGMGLINRKVEEEKYNYSVQPVPPPRALTRDEKAEQHLLREIWSRVHAGARTRDALLSVFRAVDRDRSGQLTRSEFRAAVRSLGYDLLESELDILFARFDRDYNGLVTYEEFIAEMLRFDEEERARARAAAQNASVNAMDAVAEKALLEEVKRRIRVGERPAAAIRSVFRAMDLNGSGTLTRDEFREAIKQLGYVLLDSELDMLFKRFDTDKNGSISYAEFLNGLTEANEQSKAEMEGKSRRNIAAEKALLQAVWKHMKEGMGSQEAMMSVFRLADRDGSGALTRNELREAVKFLGYNLLEPELDMLIVRFDHSQDGLVTAQEFITALLQIGQEMQAESTSSATRDVAAEKALLSEIHRRIGVGQRSTSAILSVLRSLDYNGDGTLSRTELQQGIKHLGYDLLDSELDMLMRRFDADNNGSITYKEFLDAIARIEGENIGSGTRRDVAAERALIREIRNSIAAGHRSEEALMIVFRAMDTDNSGTLNRREIRNALKQLGYELLESELDLLITRFDKNNDGLVDYQELVQELAQESAREIEERKRSTLLNAISNWQERGIDAVFEDILAHGGIEELRFLARALKAENTDLLQAAHAFSPDMLEEIEDFYVRHGELLRAHKRLQRQVLEITRMVLEATSGPGAGDNPFDAYWSPTAGPVSGSTAASGTWVPQSAHWAAKGVPTDQSRDAALDPALRALDGIRRSLGIDRPEGDRSMDREYNDMMDEPFEYEGQEAFRRILSAARGMDRYQGGAPQWLRAFAGETPGSSTAYATPASYDRPAPHGMERMRQSWNRAASSSPMHWAQSTPGGAVSAGMSAYPSRYGAQQGAASAPAMFSPVATSGVYRDPQEEADRARLMALRAREAQQTRQGPARDTSYRWWINQRQTPGSAPASAPAAPAAPAAAAGEVQDRWWVQHAPPVPPQVSTADDGHKRWWANDTIRSVASVPNMEPAPVPAPMPPALTVPTIAPSSAETPMAYTGPPPLPSPAYNRSSYASDRYRQPQPWDGDRLPPRSAPQYSQAYASYESYGPAGGTSEERTASDKADMSFRGSGPGAQDLSPQPRYQAPEPMYRAPEPLGQGQGAPFSGGGVGGGLGGGPGSGRRDFGLGDSLDDGRRRPSSGGGLGGEGRGGLGGGDDYLGGGGRDSGLRGGLGSGFDEGYRRPLGGDEGRGGGSSLGIREHGLGASRDEGGLRSGLEESYGSGRLGSSLDRGRPQLDASYRSSLSRGGNLDRTNPLLDDDGVGYDGDRLNASGLEMKSWFNPAVLEKVSVSLPSNPFAVEP